MSEADRSVHCVNDPDQPSDVLWACVEDGFHVGSRGGDFLGYVDRSPEGRYLAFDARSSAIGSYDSLNAATTAVTSSSAETILLTDAGDSLVGGDV